MKDERQYDWSLLNRDCSDIVGKVLEEWKRLVESDGKEREYQRFLAEHAGMFFGVNGTTLPISQIQLGTERRPDFTVAHDMRSGGLLYHFIELKRPSHSPFTSNGIPSQHLIKALSQVSAYKARIRDNCKEIQERLPSKRATDRCCSFTIIIGRRDNSKEWLSRRNQLAEDFDVAIRSFDWLTDQLAGRQFARSCSPYWVHGDDLTLNRLANPFAKAFTDKSWRLFLRRLQNASPEGSAAYEIHFLGYAKEEIVRSMKFNALMEEFVARPELML